MTFYLIANSRQLPALYLLSRRRRCRRVTSACGLRCRRFGKQKRRKKRKAEETEEKERKAKAASRPYLLTIVSILSRTLHWGRACGCAYLFRARYPAPERRDKANVKGGKAVHIPLTFAAAAIMGAGRGIGLNGGDKPRVGRRQARRRRRAAGARARGRARQAQHHERGQAQSARTRRETEQPPHKSELH